MNYIDDIKELVSSINKIFIGKTEIINHILMAILSSGHILIDDIPGVGKTTLVKSIAKILNLSFSRIQFTSDLLPSDIIGVSIYNRKTEKFEFKKGPIFSNIILADEINRTSPKTQSALLEAMEENQITEGNFTYKLPSPFIVLATENPVDSYGTYNLPEAQLDRFLIKTSIGYLEKSQEIHVLKNYNIINNILNGNYNISKNIDISILKSKVEEVHINDELYGYIVDIADNTRKNKFIKLGVSTRGSINIVKLSKSVAFLDNRDYVIPDDIKLACRLCIPHRIVLNKEAYISKMNSKNITDEILNNIPIPKRIKWLKLILK